MAKGLVLDFFSGSGSVAKIARAEGYEVWSTDIQQFGDISHVTDILELSARDVPPGALVAWFSPPCESFSIASVSHHWYYEEDTFPSPQSDAAKKSVQIINKVISLIDELAPAFFYIENPRGMLRKTREMMNLPAERYTVTYCQYGDDRMKPTDIWTNNPNWIPRPMCKNGDKCHEAAPRGSSTGTQGRKTYLERSRIPEELIKEILEASHERPQIH